MISFKEFVTEDIDYIYELAEGVGKKVLHVFDIDDTLVHPTAKVHVVDPSGKRVQSLNSAEYSKHLNAKKLPKDHSYDFSEFRSSDKFNKESKPIKPMINKVKTLQKDPNNHIIFNTARTNMDNKNKFLKTFEKYGIKMKKRVHVIRAGNISGPESGAEKKAKVVSGYVKKHKYAHAHMYDDDQKNLDSFSNLSNKHPDTQFHSHLVSAS